MVKRWVQRLGPLVLIILVAAGCQEKDAAAPTPPTPQSPAGQSTPIAPAGQSSMPSPEALDQDYSLAFIQLNPGTFSMEAIQANKKSIPQNPKDDKPANAAALTQLGHANFMIQRYPTAKDFYARAVHADGHAMEARLGLVNCYALMGQVDDAIREVNALLVVDPNSVEGLYNQGMLLFYGKQDRAGAKQAWERLVSAHPDNEWAHYASVRLRRL